MVETVVP